MTITADGPWQHLLYKLTGRKWGNLDVENETGCGIVPYIVQGPATWSTPCSGRSAWSCCCSSTIPWRVFLTTDHPNGGCFWRYPEIIQLLMDADFRKEQLKKLPPKAQKRIVLAELDREYTLSEIAIITSAGPARALGLSQKGHLGVGADADVAIYQREAGRRRACSRYPRYVIKGGESWSRKARSAQ